MWGRLTMEGYLVDEKAIVKARPPPAVMPVQRATPVPELLLDFLHE
jgi:hypothetical protein